MTGSHIDTVRTGGRYDGNLGVLAGLEVVATLDAAGVTTRRPLVVAFFTNEEGARFAPDMLGSLVYAGGLPLDEALAAVAIDGKVLGDELRAHRLCRRRAAARSIVRMRSSSCTSSRARCSTPKASPSARSRTCRASRGRRSPSPASPITPAPRRCACATTRATAPRRSPRFLRGLAREMGGAQVCTVGRIELVPNLINVIAARATLTADLRNTDESLLQAGRATPRRVPGGSSAATKA